MTKSQTTHLHLIIGSILAALQVVMGALAVGGALDGQVSGGVVIGLGALQAGLAYYLNNTTVPTDEVIARQDPESGPVAGPAATIMSGQPVKVTSAARKDG